MTPANFDLLTCSDSDSADSTVLTCSREASIGIVNSINSVGVTIR